MVWLIEFFFVCLFDWGFGDRVSLCSPGPSGTFWNEANLKCRVCLLLHYHVLINIWYRGFFLFYFFSLIIWLNCTLHFLLTVLSSHLFPRYLQINKTFSSTLHSHLIIKYLVLFWTEEKRGTLIVYTTYLFRAIFGVFIFISSLRIWEISFLRIRFGYVHLPATLARPTSVFPYPPNFLFPFYPLRPICPAHIFKHVWASNGEG